MFKAQRFWSKMLKNMVKEANEALNTKNFTQLNLIVDDLIELLEDSAQNWKDRVAICFILEQMAKIDPLVDKIINALLSVLNQEKEQEPHVKEFAVWALGKIVEESQSLELIRETMPVIIKFVNDDSEQVKAFATELHTRLKGFIEEKEIINSHIKVFYDKLAKFIDIQLAEMKKRSDVISKEALGLDYKAARERYDEMKQKILTFNELNQQQEDKILALNEESIKEMPAFKGEGLDLIRQWRTQRGEKEDLIRRVECIIRIQGKIHGIIDFIQLRTKDGEIEVQDLTDLTKGPYGRPYSEKEVVEILQQLVDEEIIPNFMLEQIKNYQIKADGLINEKSEENTQDDG